MPSTIASASPSDAQLDSTAAGIVDPGSGNVILPLMRITLPIAPAPGNGRAGDRLTATTPSVTLFL